MPAVCFGVSSSFPAFFFCDTATTEVYTLSLHDALPIFGPARAKRLLFTGDSLSGREAVEWGLASESAPAAELDGDRKSTRLNSSHGYTSYAVFCLKKKNK